MWRASLSMTNRSLRPGSLPVLASRATVVAGRKTYLAEVSVECGAAEPNPDQVALAGAEFVAARWGHPANDCDRDAGFRSTASRTGVPTHCGVCPIDGGSGLAVIGSFGLRMRSRTRSAPASTSSPSVPCRARSGQVSESRGRGTRRISTSRSRSGPNSDQAFCQSFLIAIRHRWAGCSDRLRI